MMNYAGNPVVALLGRQERDVELAEDVGEEGVAGEVQQPLVLRVIP